MDASFDPVTELRRHWGWVLGLGIALVVLGVLALVLEYSATIAGVAFFGAILALAGVAQIVGAIRVHGAGHIFLHLLVGVADLVVGLVVLSRPLAGALLITLLLAAMFLVGGLFRLTSALMLRYPHYGWAAFSGAISCVLGILLWIQWPVSGVWFIGFCIGLNFVMLGAAWIALAMRVR